MPKPKIFISYSHKDARWLVRLKKHLEALAGEGLLDEWDDERIGAGDSWRSEIERAMATADAAALLVSVDFLVSSFIRENELPRLLERRAKTGLPVVPVIARSCSWQRVKDLAELQARPRNGKPLAALYGDAVDRELSALAEEIVDLATKRGPETQAITRGTAPRGAPREASFSPPAPVSGSLPAPLGSFVGRSEELARLEKAAELRALPATDSRRLLLSIAPRLGSEAGAVALCGHLPLALRLAGFALDEDPDLTPKGLRERLERAGPRAEIAERMIGVAMDLLEEPLRPALRALSAFPAAFDPEAAAAVLDCPAEEAAETLAELVRRGLLEADEGRFRLHDLIRRTVSGFRG